MLQVLRAAEMFALLRVALVVRIPSGTTSAVEQAARAAAAVVLRQAASAALGMVWSSQRQKAYLALQVSQVLLNPRRPPLRAQLQSRRKVFLTPRLALLALTDTGRSSHAVQAQAVVETFASLQVASVASTSTATTSYAAHTVVVL